VTPSNRPVSPEQTPRLVPAWLQNLEAFGWRILVIGGLAVVLTWIALTLVAETAALVLSAVIAAAAAPLVISLRRQGRSRVRAALAAWALVGSIIVVGLALVAIAFVPSIAALLDALQHGLGAIRSGSAGFNLPPEVSSTIDRVAAVVSAFVQEHLGELGARIATTATIAILSTFLTFFFLLDADRGADWALQGIPQAERAALRARGYDATVRVGGLMRATAAASAARAAAMLAVMLVLGTPSAGPLAAFLLIGGLIPYLGPLVATSAIVLVALGGQGLVPALLLLAAAVAIEVALMVGRSRLEGSAPLHVHPAIVLLALPIGAVAAGLIGTIVAVPVAAFLQEMTGTALAAFQPRLPTISSSGPVVPAWLDRLAQWSRGLLIGVGLLVGFVVLTIQLSAPVLAVVLAAVLAATIAPAATALRRRGAGPTVAALGATVGLVAGIGAVLILTIASLSRDMSQVVATSSAGSSGVDQAAHGSLAWLVALTSNVSGEALNVVIALAAVPPGLVFVVTLAAILTFFFLRDGAAAWRWATGRLRGWRRNEVDAAGARAAGVLGGYMIATAVISAFGAATQFAIMAVLGIPLALPLAVLSFFGGFIPYFGSFITTGIALLVTVAVGSPTDIAVMTLFTVVFNIVQGNFVAPLVYGRAVSIHPAVVLLAIPAGSTIAGVFGMFIIVPLIGVIVATWRTVLLVLGDGPGDSGSRSIPEGTEARSGGPGPALDHEGGTSSATAT
jgi:predicted PurR-regulated permease PerM